MGGRSGGRTRDQRVLRQSTTRTAAIPSHPSGRGGCASRRTDATASGSPAGSKTNWFAPHATVSGHSVVSRTVRHGTPSAALSTCNPPESVTTACAASIRSSISRYPTGSIILTASVSGLTAWSHAAPYCATKAAVIHLAKVAAVEYARDGIRVNSVCPGTFRSAIHDGLPPEALDAVAARHPLGLGTAADLVGAYSYLASEAARWTTGSALVVDGGYSAP